MESIAHICQRLEDSDFINRNKISVTAFTRVRKLTFIIMFILILRNSAKSLKLVLNESEIDTNKDYSITAGAFTKARKKLKYTAFTELNDDIINSRPRRERLPLQAFIFAQLECDERFPFADAFRTCNECTIAIY